MGTSWNELAPAGTTWWDFAYTGVRWKTWRELYVVPVYCPGISSYRCTGDAEQCLPTIIVYSDSNNAERIKLCSECIPYALNMVQKITVVFDNGTEYDSDTYPAEISWSTATTGDDVGVVTFRFGLLEIESGIYTVKLIVHDPSVQDGLYWGQIRVRAVRDDI